MNEDEIAKFHTSLKVENEKILKCYAYFDLYVSYFFDFSSFYEVIIFFDMSVLPVLSYHHDTRPRYEKYGY